MKPQLPNCLSKSVLLTLILSALTFLQVKAANPYLVLNGADTIVLEQGRTFTDAGATAYDAANNVISNANIVITSPNAGYHLIPGTYLIKYNYTDNNGNKAAEIKRAIIIIPDSTKPVLSIAGISADSFGFYHDTVGINEKYTIPIAKAYDNVDGDLSASIVVESDVNVTRVTWLYGIYENYIEYSVSDAAGNRDSILIDVRVIDTIAPVIEIGGALHDTIYVGQKYEFDPNYTERLKYTDNDSMGATMVWSYGSLFEPGVLDSFGRAIKPGTFVLGFQALDGSGNFAKDSIFVHIIDKGFSISGTVTLPGITGMSNVNAHVYLIKYDATDSSLSLVKSTFMNFDTVYYFFGIDSGQYLIKAALDSTDSHFANYLPTYYDTSLTWDNAQTIQLTANTTINISLLSGTNTGGPGFISGKVSQGANKKEGDPVENIQITLTTNTDKPVAYTYSDKNGYFEFKNLALGTYKLFAEIEGKKALGGEIILTEENMQQSKVAVTVNSSSVFTTILEDSTATGLAENTLNAEVNIYPNPAQNKIYISAKDNSIKYVRLYNTAGQLLINREYNSVRKIQLEVGEIPAGMYFLNLQYTNKPAERKLVIITH